MLHLVIRPAHRRIALVIAALLLVAGALLVAVAPTANAQAAPTAPITYVYLRTNGDTLGIETLAHGATTVTGVLSMKGQPRIEWIQAHQNMVPGILTMRVFAPGADAGATPVQSGTVEPRGDSVYVDFIGGTQRTKQGIGSKAGALPLVNASVLHAALMAMYAHRAQLSTVNVVLTSGAQTLVGTVGQSGDTTSFKLATSDMRIVPAPDGLPAVVLLPGQGVRVVRATSAINPSVGGRINYDAPVGAPYSTEQVNIPTGRGYELAATLTKPDGVARMPVIITISGSGPQERDSRISIVPGYEIFRQIADTLGRRGIAVLRYDDRGVGESTGRESAAKATSADFADDVRSVVTWLRARADVDSTRIGLAGHSEGGLIAPMVAAADQQIKAVALLAGPAYTGRRVLMYQNRQGIDNAPGLTKKQRDSIWARVPAQLDSAGKATPWLGYFMAHDPLKTARAVKQPVLVLQGLTDHQVTPEQSDALAAALRTSGNKGVTLRKLPATNHLFLTDASGVPSGYATLKDTKVAKETLGVIADWAVRVMSK